ncbi:MAG: hypothetical protein WD021_04000 [Rhodothermales bacterium]
MKSLLSITFALLFGLASTAQAQSAQVQQVSDRDDVFRQLVTIQMVESLASPNAMIRNQTLKNAIVFNTLYPERADLYRVVSSIAAVAESDVSESNRRLAVAALRSIDSYRARQYLAEIDGMEDADFHRLVAGVLTEYREARVNANTRRM